jgi:hypothetical protein
MPRPTGYEVRFQPLLGRGRELAFPCDAKGDVTIDALSDLERDCYLYARAVIGYEFARPEVRACGLQCELRCDFE